MAFRFFPGTSKSTLEAKLADVNEQLLAGKMATSSGAADINASFQRETNLREVQQQILWDLNQIDPGAGYDQHLIPSRTKAGFAPARDFLL